LEGVSPIVLRLRALRERKGWSQAALAKRAGIRQATVSDLETGRSRSISLGVLERLADALEEAPGALFGQVIESTRRTKSVSRWRG
jgi:transcriptional regulator with XRE-family HTH domain